MNIYIKNASEIKKIVILAVLAAQALVLSIIESWIPIPIGIPGIKLGLANIITIIVLIFFSLSDAMIIILIRCILSSLFMGGPVIFMFSICGGILSAIIMWILLKSVQKWFSLVGISIIGSIVHNIAQIAVACLIMNDLSVATYLPVLLISGIIMGCFVGYCSTFLVSAIKRLNIIANI
ncbi:MAG TPA: Gx transporter family protein [Ruminiclostridium sp.]